MDKKSTKNICCYDSSHCKPGIPDKGTRCGYGTSFSPN